jgi:hypothetical protein
MTDRWWLTQDDEPIEADPLPPEKVEGDSGTVKDDDNDD